MVQWSNEHSSAALFLFWFWLFDWPKEATVGILATLFSAASFVLLDQWLVMLTNQIKVFVFASFSCVYLSHPLPNHLLNQQLASSAVAFLVSSDSTSAL